MAMSGFYQVALKTLCVTALIVTVAHAEGVAEESALALTECAPTGELRGDTENGKALHMEHCVACHGLTGAADVVVMHMDETPPDQSDPDYMQNLPDGYLYLAICRGGEGIGKSYVMSPWGDYFTDQEIKDLIAWVRTFSDT
jgi:mono/diheme cytochrome c family protein